MDSLISIVIPYYNQPNELRLALDSISKQTHKNIEVIIVDDGSKERLKIEDLRFKIKLVRQENRGAPSARNRGLELAKGEYIIFWDADVIAKPEMLENMYYALQAHPEASFAYSNFYFGWKRMKGQSYEATKLRENNYIHSTSLIRKKDAIAWDESLKRFQDWDYWLTMGGQGKTGVWIDQYLFKVIPGGTMSKWLPKFAYKKPWKFIPGFRSRVESYEKARGIVLKKHKLE
jgi:glycosyltransferase involved in cell wall biosynthesis